MTYTGSDSEEGWEAALGTVSCNHQRSLLWTGYGPCRKPVLPRASRYCVQLEWHYSSRLLGLASGL